jgi:signal transduction histidine kinase
MASQGIKYLCYGIVLLIVFSSRQTALAQTDNFRKLHEKLQHAKDSSDYVKTLNSLSFFHHRNNLDSCFWYATKALEIAQRLHDGKGISYAYTNFALFYTRKRNTKLAIVYNYKALQIDEALSDSGSISIDLSNLALAYRAEGNFGKAQEYEQRSLWPGSRFPDLGDYKIDLINYLEYYWKNPAKSDSVKWALNELRGIAAKKPYSMEWYEARLFEAMTTIKTRPFSQTEKRINELAEEAYKKGLPDESLTAYFHLKGDVKDMGYKVDSIAYAEKIFRLGKEIGDNEAIMDVMPNLYAYYLPEKDWKRIALYGASIRQLATFEQSEPGKLPAVDYISYFLKEQQMQELQITDQLQQHAIVQSDLQRESHRWLLIFLLSLLVLLLIFTAIYCFSYYASRRHAAALAALNAGITEKNTQLQADDDFKNRLLSLIANDFRTPIKDIIETAALWQTGTHYRDTLLDSIQRVEQDSRITLDNFDGILRWIKSQFSDFAYYPVACNIEEMLREVVESMQADANNKELTMHPDLPAAIVVAADPEMLQFVHRTLLRQIMTLTDTGGSIRIKAQQHAGETVVTVQGHPITVTDSLLNLLNFPQQEDKLMLVTCNDFMNKMGGSLVVRSTTPDTFAFVYTLPWQEV